MSETVIEHVLGVCCVDFLVQKELVQKFSGKRMVYEMFEQVWRNTLEFKDRSDAWNVEGKSDRIRSIGVERIGKP